MVVLVLAGAVGWWVYLRPDPGIDPSSLEAVPIDLPGWVGKDLPVSEGVERILRADTHVQRIYRDGEDGVVWLYVGYYGTARGGRPEHTPWVCYPSAGWTILSSIERSLADAEADAAATETANGVGHAGEETDDRINEIVVDNGRERRLVRFWYMTHRSTALASETALTFDHIFGRFSVSGRADGALVRISTPIAAGGVEAARSVLEGFSGPLVDELTEHWPAASPLDEAMASSF